MHAGKSTEKSNLNNSVRYKNKKMIKCISEKFLEEYAIKIASQKQINSKSHMLKYGNIVSVRGKGRFIFDEIISTTKKGRYFIKIRKYI